MPDICDHCKSRNVILTQNSTVYGRLKGNWPYCYYCNDCESLIGCHPNTYKPLGLMAPDYIRRRRAKLHKLFDPIWENNLLSRSDAYNWLARVLDIDERTCHISWLGIRNLEKAILELSKHKETDYVFFKRRKEKSIGRKYYERQREKSRITRRRFK